MAECFICLCNLIIGFVLIWLMNNIFEFLFLGCFRYSEIEQSCNPGGFCFPNIFFYLFIRNLKFLFLFFYIFTHMQSKNTGILSGALLKLKTLVAATLFFLPHLRSVSNFCACDLLSLLFKTKNVHFF